MFLWRSSGRGEEGLAVGVLSLYVPSGRVSNLWRSAELHNLILRVANLIVWVDLGCILSQFIVFYINYYR